MGSYSIISGEESNDTCEVVTGIWAIKGRCSARKDPVIPVGDTTATTGGVFLARVFLGSATAAGAAGVVGAGAAGAAGAGTTAGAVKTATMFSAVAETLSLVVVLRFLPVELILL